MIRVNRIIDHTLAILRKAFIDHMDGGFIPYDGRVSCPPTGVDVPTNPLRWDKMSIEVDTPDLDDGRTSGSFDANGNPLPDTRDTVAISVLSNTDSVKTTKQNHARFPSTTTELTIVVAVSVKDERWMIRLQNALVGYIEQTLWANQTLLHPDEDNNTEAAEALYYVRTEVNTDPSEDSLIPIGATSLILNVVPKPNKRIELKSL